MKENTPTQKEAILNYHMTLIRAHESLVDNAAARMSMLRNGRKPQVIGGWDYRNAGGDAAVALIEFYRSTNIDELRMLSTLIAITIFKAQLTHIVHGSPVDVAELTREAFQSVYDTLCRQVRAEALPEGVAISNKEFADGEFYHENEKVLHNLEKALIAVRTAYKPKHDSSPAN